MSIVKLSILQIFIMMMACTVLAQEKGNFMGQIPTPDQLVEALSLPEESGVRSRGINLNGSSEKEVTPPRAIIDIKFDFSSDYLTVEATKTLDSLNQALTSSKMQGGKFRIEGHTDASGSEEYNHQLGQRRAEKVAEYISEYSKNNGITLIVESFGENRLLVEKDPMSENNRRVEVVNITNL